MIVKKKGDIMNTNIEILKYAMNMEKRAQEFYSLYRDKVSNPTIKALFEELSEMEIGHYEMLKNQVESLEQTGDLAEIDLEAEEGNSIIKTGSKALEGVSLEYDMADLPILRMAYSMEDDFANYYKAAAEKTEDEKAKKLLNALSRWEIKHRDSFAEQVKNAQMNIWFDNSFSPF